MPRRKFTRRVGRGWVTVSIWNRKDEHVMLTVSDREHTSDSDDVCAVPVYINRLQSTGVIRYGNPRQDAILNLHQALLPQLVRVVIHSTPKAKEILFGSQATASAEPAPMSTTVRQLQQFGRSKREYKVTYKGMQFVLVPAFDESMYRGDRSTNTLFRIDVNMFIGYDRVNEIRHARRQDLDREQPDLPQLEHACR